MSTWLTRVPNGWTEPLPDPCTCGERRHVVGWTACDCGGGPLEIGHRTWECTACSRRRVLGCTRTHEGAPAQP